MASRLNTLTKKKKKSFSQKKKKKHLYGIDYFQKWAPSCRCCKNYQVRRQLGRHPEHALNTRVASALGVNSAKLVSRTSTYVSARRRLGPNHKLCSPEMATASVARGLSGDLSFETQTIYIHVQTACINNARRKSVFKLPRFESL